MLINYNYQIKTKWVLQPTFLFVYCIPIVSILVFNIIIVLKEIKILVEHPIYNNSIKPITISIEI